MFFQTVKFGARYTELDLFENNDGNIVVSNGIFEGNWRLTLNEIFLEDFCRDIFHQKFLIKNILLILMTLLLST